MATIEERVEQLEREVSALKAQASTIDEDVKTIPDLIKMEHRLTNTQFTRALQQLETRLLQEVESLPRTLAEMVQEMFDARDRKR